MIRPYGMAQVAFDAYIKAMYQAGIDPEHTAAGSNRVVQTIGNAAASAGTHAQDGVDQFGHDYCAAVDISVRHDLNEQQIDRLLECLWTNGFAAYYRHTGSFAGNHHIHAVYAGVPMKASLRSQIHDFLHHRNGLVGHEADQFVADNLTEDQEQHVRRLFLSCNQVSG